VCAQIYWAQVSLDSCSRISEVISMCVLFFPDCIRTFSDQKSDICRVSVDDTTPRETSQLHSKLWQRTRTWNLKDMPQRVLSVLLGKFKFPLSSLLKFTFIRGLAFTCKALQNMQSDPNSELHVCFKRSYDEVLRHHHSFIIRSVVSVS